MAAVGVGINSIIDVTSGIDNGRLTPGGGINLTGAKIKIAGENANIGIKLTEQNTSAEVVIPITSILVNEPSRITFIVPADLPNGDYKLSLTTQYSHSSATLKEPRTCIFDYMLNVLK